MYIKLAGWDRDAALGQIGRLFGVMPRLGFGGRRWRAPVFSALPQCGQPLLDTVHLEKDATARIKRFGKIRIERKRLVGAFKAFFKSAQRVKRRRAFAPYGNGARIDREHFIEGA